MIDLSGTVIRNPTPTKYWPPLKCNVCGRFIGSRGAHGGGEPNMQGDYNDFWAFCKDHRETR